MYLCVYDLSKVSEVSGVRGGWDLDTVRSRCKERSEVSGVTGGLSKTL